MNMIFKELEVIEFLSKYRQSQIIPMANTKEIKNLLIYNKIFVSELIAEPNKDPYFFLEFINSIKKNDICIVINYTLYKRDLAILTTNYNGRIHFDTKNENRVYFEVNNTLVDKDVKLDWFDIWGHACEGWVMNDLSYELFIKYLNDDITSDNDIKAFLDNLKFKFEFGDVHESIRFISLNAELSNDLNILYENDLNRD